MGYPNLKDARLFLGLSQTQVSAESGVSQATISKIESGKAEFIPTEYILYLKSKGIDLNWLYSDLELPIDSNLKAQPNAQENGKVKGNPMGNLKGNLMGKVNTKNQHQEQSQGLGEKEPKGIPLIPVEAIAGYGEGDSSVLEHELTYYYVPEFKEAHFLIRVRGSSMYPKYNSGDILACKYIKNPLFIQWNKVYILDTSQGAMLKRLFPTPSEDIIELRSDNIEYPPFTIPKSDIRSMAIVVGVIRVE
jgi:phage repressor protein C with HTH and peptisase S24 domain